jgi:hypothetical protein
LNDASEGAAICLRRAERPIQVRDTENRLAASFAGYIRTTRSSLSQTQKYSSPTSLLVGPDANGEWPEFDDLSESKP